ncbi:hypothetical protein WM31_27900 [Burkholderia ubonensis]|nr:hypothetical protein WM31_27900 [Burkholderia ubonensis]
MIVGGENNRSTKLLPEIYGSRADAEAAAKAGFARTQRGQATFDMTLALGRADVYRGPLDFGAFYRCRTI